MGPAQHLERAGGDRRDRDAVDDPVHHMVTYSRKLAEHHDQGIAMSTRCARRDDRSSPCPWPPSAGPPSPAPSSSRTLTCAMVGTTLAPRPAAGARSEAEA
jgi:hypothetical protein